MARIKRNNARKPIESGATAFPGIKYERTDEQVGLRFEIQIGFHKVSLTHLERDMIVEKWAELERQYESGSIS